MEEDAATVAVTIDDTTNTPPPAGTTFVPPSIHRDALLSGASYSHFSPIPASLLPTDPANPATAPPCVLGVDEAGRGPVLGPMVYGVFFLPIPLSDPLLRESDAHRFDDSKVLTPAYRSRLMEELCTPGTDLHNSCGWATAALSARDIAANMLRPGAAYNLNAQAMDATVALIRRVYDLGVNIREIYVDTIGQPAAYQAKLKTFFPAADITVAKKADSLYPCVSAASVCAKVTRDVALETMYDALHRAQPSASSSAADEPAVTEGDAMAWGSGYPSDARCVSWMRANMHPVFGWGPECRYSWGTARDMLETKGAGVTVEWPAEEDPSAVRLTDYFTSAGKDGTEVDELGTWFGTPAGLETF